MSKYAVALGMSCMALFRPPRYLVGSVPEMLQEASMRQTLSCSPSPSSDTARLSPRARRKSMLREARYTTQSLSEAIAFLTSATLFGPDSASTTNASGSEPSARRRP